MKYRVIISERALAEMRKQFLYYEEQQAGLGVRFLEAIREYEQVLHTFPMAQVRYANVTCIPVRRFPFMIHFIVDENSKTVTIHALVGTARDPDANWNLGDLFVSEPLIIYGVAV